MKTIHLAVVGNSGTQKTSYIRSLCSDEFNSSYKKTEKIEETSFFLKTNKGSIQILFYDFPSEFLSSKEEFNKKISGILCFISENMKEIPISLLKNYPSVFVSENINYFPVQNICLQDKRNLRGPLLLILRKILNDQNIFLPSE